MVTPALQWKRKIKALREQTTLTNSGTDDEDLEQLQEDIQNCRKCDLCTFDVNTKGIDFGTGKLILNHKNVTMFQSTLFFVGLCPSYRRFDKECRAFEGVEDTEIEHMKTSGGIFDKALKDSGIIEHNIYIDNILHCSTANNTTPSKEQISKCIEWLKKEIKIIQPRKVIALGNDVYKILEKELVDINVVKIFHPAYILRDRSKYFELVGQLKRLK